MIPEAYIRAWYEQAPWQAWSMVEQDLILSRTLVDLFHSRLLADSLILRGGTVLHKLFFPRALRYSEDIDLVQRAAGPIGPVFDSMSADIEEDGKGGNTTILRAKLVDNKLVNQEILYKATPNTKSGNHFGSRLEFDREGYLYFSIGDRHNRDVNPQDITKDNGKIYRINDDGSIPLDNPFYNTDGAKKAIYSYGHRNPQGMAMNPQTGEIWTHEHGPQGGDEINIIKPGINYGWPKITYGINYDNSTITNDTSLPGMEQPLHYWVPSIAPSGMAFVTSNKYPNWKGNLMVGSLKFKYLNRVVLENNKVIKEEKILENMVGKVRNVRQSPDGYLYVAVEQLGVLRIVPE